MTTHTTATAGLTLAAIMTAQPFGLQIETIAIGTCFSIVGVIGRAGFELGRAAEGPGGMKLSRIAAWVGAGFVGAPFATILYLVILKLMGVQSDGIATIGLLFFGFSGPRMITWLLNLAIGILNKRLGSNIPPLGGTTTASPGSGTKG